LGTKAGCAINVKLMQVMAKFMEDQELLLAQCAVNFQSR